MSIFRDPIPREVPVVAEGERFASKRWLAFFEQFYRFFTLTEAAHADRLDATKVWHGTRLYETDRTVSYECRIVSGAKAWVYVSGTMRNTLANKPTDLGTNDAGFLFYATNYVRTFRWTGSAWEYAQGERLTREIIWYPGTLPASGWAICDGSSVTVTAADATTGSFTTPDLTGQFPKGGTYDGSVVAAATPTITGATASDGAHTHTVSGTAAATANTAGSNIAAGGTLLDTVGHTHAVTGTAASDGAHTHDAGTLALSGSAEPAHVLLLPIVKL